MGDEINDDNYLVITSTSSDMGPLQLLYNPVMSGTEPASWGYNQHQPTMGTELAYGGILGADPTA